MLTLYDRWISFSACSTPPRSCHLVTFSPLTQPPLIQRPISLTPSLAHSTREHPPRSSWLFSCLRTPIVSVANSSAFFVPPHASCSASPSHHWLTWTNGSPSRPASPQAVLHPESHSRWLSPHIRTSVSPQFRMLQVVREHVRVCYYPSPSPSPSIGCRWAGSPPVRTARCH